MENKEVCPNCGKQDTELWDELSKYDDEGQGSIVEFWICHDCGNGWCNYVEVQA